MEANPAKRECDVDHEDQPAAERASGPRWRLLEQRDNRCSVSAVPSEPSPHPAGISGARLDHVACGVPSVLAAAAFVAGALGGRPSEGGPGVGFEGGQWRFEGGGLLEVLQPAGRPGGFLHRFVERGPGIHHVTFKVPALEEAAERAQAFGYAVVGYSVVNPGWKECFLHPKEAQGIVVQLAESDPALDPDWGAGWAFPPPPAAPPPAVRLVGVRLSARSAEAARRQWGTLLGGRASLDGDGLEFRWKESPLRIAVTLDPVAPPGPLCLEIAATRPLRLPDGPHPALGARFALVPSPVA